MKTLISYLRGNRQIFFDKNKLIAILFYDEKGNLIRYNGQKINGRVKTFNRNNILYSVEYFKNNKLDGICKVFYADGISLKHIYRYKNGKLHGKSFCFNENGIITLISSYFYGKLDGWTYVYDEMGKIRYKIKYDRNERFYQSVHYRDNGKKFFKLLSDGINEETIYYDKNGKIKNKIYTINNKIVNYKKYKESIKKYARKKIKNKIWYE